jgi:hypothetical protein
MVHHLLCKNYKWHTTWIQQFPVLKWHTTHFKGLCTVICISWNAALQDVAMCCRMITARSFKGFKCLDLQIYLEVKGMWSHRISETTRPHIYPTECQKLLHNDPTECQKLLAPTIIPQNVRNYSLYNDLTDCRNCLHLNDPTDCQKLFAQPHSITSQNTCTFSITAVKSPNFKIYKCSLLTCIQPSK